MRTPDLSTVTWRKSSHSGQNGSCVEVAFVADAVGVRDSKDPAGPPLAFHATIFATFRDAVVRGDFDRP